MKAMIFLASALFIATTAPAVTINFGRSYQTCLSNELIWNQFNKALLNSDESSLWPQNLSSVRGDGIEEEAFINVTYKTSFSSPTYTYSISDVVPFVSFTYKSVKNMHPFEGGAQINIEDAGEYRVLSWTGEYITPTTAWIKRRFFQSYSKNFFNEIEDRLKLLEKTNCVEGYTDAQFFF